MKLSGVSLASFFGALPSPNYKFNTFGTQHPRGPQNMVGETPWTSIGSRKHPPRRLNRGSTSLLRLQPSLPH